MKPCSVGFMHIGATHRVTETARRAFSAPRRSHATLRTLLRTWWVVHMEDMSAMRVQVIRSSVAGEPTRLRLSGPLGIGSLDALDAALQRYPAIREVELDSQGGLVFEGFAITEGLARIPGLRIPLMADSDSISIADSVPGDGGHVAQVS